MSSLLPMGLNFSISQLPDKQSILDNLTQFNKDNINYLLQFNSLTPMNWYQNPVNLINDKCYFIVIDNSLVIFKQKWAFGYNTFRMLGLPISAEKDKALSILKHLNQFFDILLTKTDMEFIDIKVPYSIKPYKEFLYAPATYQSKNNLPLEGNNFKEWRKSLNKFNKHYFTYTINQSKASFKDLTIIRSIIGKWLSLQPTSRPIAQHLRWYIDSINDLYSQGLETAIFIYLEKHSNLPIGYDITVKLNNQVYLLDGKILHNIIPHNITKAIHFNLIDYWHSTSPSSELIFNSGLGDKPFTAEGITFDLNKNKTILRPFKINPYYQLKANTL